MWRIALMVYKGALLSVLHVSSSRNMGKMGAPRGWYGEEERR